jgi:hypothetical protein
LVWDHGWKCFDERGEPDDDDEGWEYKHEHDVDYYYQTCYDYGTGGWEL